MCTHSLSIVYVAPGAYAALYYTNMIRRYMVGRDEVISPTKQE